MKNVNSYETLSAAEESYFVYGKFILVLFNAILT